MYKLCKTKQSAQRQRVIENTLFLLMKKKNYSEITVTEMCIVLDNMPRKTFYRYFDSKDDALYALIEHTMLDYSDFHEKSIMGTDRMLKKEIYSFLNFWVENKEFLDVFNRNGMLDKIIEVSANLPIGDLVSISKFLPDDSEWAQKKIFKFAIGGLITAMLDWYKEDFKTNISDMVELCCRILSKPLFPNLKMIGISVD